MIAGRIAAAHNGSCQGLLHLAGPIVAAASCMPSGEKAAPQLGLEGGTCMLCSTIHMFSVTLSRLPVHIRYFDEDPADTLTMIITSSLAVDLLHCRQHRGIDI